MGTGDFSKSIFGYIAGKDSFMAKIPIFTKIKPDTVLLSRTFITDYMAEADALCLKTYLYLLNALSCAEGVSIELKEMEEDLGTDRASLCQALNYWDEKGLLRLEQQDLRISSIQLLPVKPRSEEHGLYEEGAPSSPETAGMEPAGSETPVQTSDPLLELESDPHFKILLQTLQGPSLMGSELKRYQVDTLLEIFRWFERDEEAILSIADYCQKNKTKKTPGQSKLILKFDTFKGLAEEVYDALGNELARHPEDVLKKVTEFLAHTYTHRYDTLPYYTKEDEALTKVIFSKLGLDAMQPTVGEINSVHSWRKTFGPAADEILLEACTRTRSKQLQTAATGDPLSILHYYNVVLGNWNKEGFRSLNEIREADEKHRNERKAAAEQEKTTPKDYNDFPQHDYDYNQHANEVIFKMLEAKKKS